MFTSMQKIELFQKTLIRDRGHIAVGLLTIATYMLLLFGWSLDNNSLVAWRWVFTIANPAKVLLAICIVVIIAYLLSKISFAERYHVAALFIVSFAAAALFWRVPEVIVDASRYFTQAKHLELYGAAHFFKEWGRGIAVWTDLPLVPFIYGLLFKLLGESRLYIQIFTTLLFSLTVVLTYKIGRMVWNADAGLTGGLLLLGIPYLFMQVPLMLVDVPAMFFLALAIFTFIKALTRGGALLIVLSSLAVFAAFMSKYSNWLMLSVLCTAIAVYFAAGRNSGRVQVARSFFSGSTRYAALYRGTLIALISGVLVGSMVALKYDVFAAQTALLMDYQRYGLTRWGESHISTFLFQVHPFISLAAVWSAYAVVSKRDLKYLIVAWTVILVLLLQVERARYMLVAFPMLALMASYGLQQIRREDLRRYVALCAVGSSVAIAFFGYLPFMQRISAVNLRDAGAYLNSSDSKSVLVVTKPVDGYVQVNPAVAVPLIDLFTDRPVSYSYAYAQPSPEKVSTSSLRFTWDYRNPAYYTTRHGMRERSAIAVIAGTAEKTLLNDIEQDLTGYRLSRVFATDSGFFRYKTIVKVYEPLSEDSTQAYRLISN